MKPRQRSPQRFFLSSRSFTAALRVLCVAAAFFCCGCAGSLDRPAVVDSISELPDIRDRFSSRLGELFKGMSRESVLDIFPEAEPVALREGVDAWEVVLVQTYVLRGDPESNLAFSEGLATNSVRFDRQSIWLYFKADRLLSWDDPQTWPRDGDVKVDDWR